MLQMIIKPFLNNLSKEIIGIVENVIKQVAESENLVQNELSATISRKEKNAILEVLDKEGTPIYETNAGELIEEIFKAQLNNLPKIAANYFTEKMEGQSDIKGIVYNSLDDCSLLACYEANLLVIYHVTKEGAETINLDQFLADNLKDL